MSLLCRKITKPSSIHTVTGYRILSGCYFVQLTHLQSPNFNTHHATKTNTQPSSSNANLSSYFNKCTNMTWQNSLDSNCIRNLDSFNVTFAPTRLSVGV
jgi:hypothetical protein